MFLTTFWGRLLFAVSIFLVDTVIFFLPVGTLFLAYVILVRPPWFKEWINKLYG